VLHGAENATLNAHVKTLLSSHHTPWQKEPQEIYVSHYTNFAFQSFNSNNKQQLAGHKTVDRHDPPKLLSLRKISSAPTSPNLFRTKVLMVEEGQTKRTRRHQRAIAIGITVNAVTTISIHVAFN